MRFEVISSNHRLVDQIVKVLNLLGRLNELQGKISPKQLETMSKETKRDVMMS